MAREPWSGLPQVNGAERLTSRVADLLARELFEKQSAIEQMRVERFHHEESAAELGRRIKAMEAEIAEVQTPILSEPVEFTSLQRG
jgi:hypothetical protein